MLNRMLVVVCVFLVGHAAAPGESGPPATSQPSAAEYERKQTEAIKLLDRDLQTLEETVKKIEQRPELSTEDRAALDAVRAQQIEAKATIESIRGELAAIREQAAAGEKSMKEHVAKVERLLTEARQSVSNQTEKLSGFRTATELRLSRRGRTVSARLSAVNGVQKVPLAGRKVKMSRQVDDGPKTLIEEAMTDADGAVRFEGPVAKEVARGTFIVVDFEGDDESRPATVRFRLRNP